MNSYFRHLELFFHKNIMKIIFIVYFFFFIVFLYKGPRITKDSIGYINMDVIRSPIYPLIVNFFKLIFAGLYQFVLIGFQLLLCFISTFSFLKYVKNKFNTSYIVLLCLALFLVYPIYSYGNEILTEAVSYSLFLGVVIFLFEWFERDSIKQFYLFLISNSLLVLTRGQFLFFYIFPFLYILWKFYKKEIKIIESIKIVILTILVLFSVNLFDKAYHMTLHGKFASTPFTGVQLITDALYVSDEEDHQLFEDDDNRELYKLIYRTMMDKNLNLNSLKIDIPNYQNENLTYHYNMSYNEISHRVAENILMDFYKEKTGIEQRIAVDKHLATMSILLIQDNTMKYLKLYMRDVIDNGFRGNIACMFFISLFFISLFYLLIFNKKKVY